MKVIKLSKTSDSNNFIIEDCENSTTNNSDLLSKNYFDKEVVDKLHEIAIKKNKKSF